MEILNNPWITGIGGGIVSGLIVYFVTSKLLSKKQDKEYSQKITTANNEILYTMRPLIVQNKFPNEPIISSIILSIARKYEVNKNDLFDIPILIDDLIREVMENTFLDSEQKMDFCTKINELKIEATSPEKEIKVYEKIIYQKDRLSSKYVSTLMAATATMMVLFTTLFTTMDSTNFSGFKNISEISTIIISAVVPMMAMVMTMSLKRMRNFNRDKIDQVDDKEEKNKND